MDFNRFKNEKIRKQMEDEMNRFEQEIHGSSTFQTNVPNQKPLQSLFIPHQLQKQQNRMNVHLSNDNVALQAQNQLNAPILQGNHSSNQKFIPHNNHLNVVPSLPVIQTFQNSQHFPLVSSSNLSYVSSPNLNINSQIQTQPVQKSSNSNTSYTVTPIGLPTNVHSVPNTLPGPSSNNKTKAKSNESKNKKQKKNLRMAGGTTWEDLSLQEWDSDDFRIFCGDLGNDVNDDILSRAFNKYPSFLKCKVVRDKRTNKSKGYGFISFKDPNDFTKAMREMNGKYVGSRPIKLRKSIWKDRNLDQVKKKQKQKQKLGLI